MVAKILFSLTSVVNLGTYEDFNEENPKKSIVEEDISINKNNWNTRKWGSIYFLVKPVMFYVFDKITDFKQLYSTYSLPENLIVYILPFFISAGVKYQYFFHKNCGISIKLFFNNNISITEDYLDYSDSTTKIYHTIGISPSIECIYKKRLKHIFSCSFSFIKNCGISIKLFFNNNISITEDYLDYSDSTTKIYHTIGISPSIECIYKKRLKHIFSCSFSFISISISKNKKLYDKNAKYSDLRFSLPIYINFYPFQYEYNRCFLLKYGLLQTPFVINLLNFSKSISYIKENLKDKLCKGFTTALLLNLEFELNIIGLNDLRKKKNK